MKNKLLNALKYSVFLGIGLFLLYLAFRNQDFNKIGESLKQADYRWILLSIFISFFSFVSRAHRWNMLIKPMGYSPSLTNSTYALMFGYMANFAIPRLGEVSRCAMLGKAEKIPMDKLIGTVIAERAIDLFTLILILAYLGITQFDILGGFLYDQLFGPLLEKVQTNFILILIALALMFLVGLLYFIFSRKKKDKTTVVKKSKIESLLLSVWEGIKTVLKLENKTMFFIHTVFIWSGYLFSTYFCFFAFEATSHLGINEGIFTLAIGGIGMSAPVQGGIGAFHWLVSEGLQLYSVPFDEGLIFATIVHASQTIFIVLFGIFSYFALLLKNK